VNAASGDARRAWAAIIVHFGDDGPCIEAAESVRSSRGVEARIAIVDHNARPSARLEAWARAAGGAYISCPGNPGFGAGANEGVRVALERWGSNEFLVLNPDVRLDTSCLATLDATFTTYPSIGVAGPALIWDAFPGRWWNVGSDVEWPAGRPRSRRHAELIEASKEPAERVEASWEPVEDTGFVAGAAVAFTLQAWTDAHGFAEDYFLYFEDADFSYRVRATGHRVVICPRACAFHRGGGASPASVAVAEYYRARNRLRFSRAWNPLRARGAGHRAAFTLRLLVRGLWRGAITRRRSELLPFFAAIDHLRGRGGRLPTAREGTP